jgi:multidrug transporter EmrE-like cation transporter
VIKAILFCFVYALLNVSGAAIIKYNLKGRSLIVLNDWIRFLMQAQIILAFIVIFLSALVLFKALSSGNFTFIIPVAVGINFILTVATGYFVFKDHLTIGSYFGLLMIISGIIILSLNNSKHA